MTLPLLERFPGTATLPLAGIASLPTPVDDGADLLPLGPDPETVCPMRVLWVKRDDLTSPLYGGNKVRKLDFLLGQALAEERRAVVTFGAYGSNHALATAVHARALGLEPHAVLSPQAPGPYASRTLLAHAGLGTVLHLVDGWDGAREAVRVAQALTERDGVEPMVIPMGGTSALGALGYVNAALEPVIDEIDRVYVAAGTLGTAVGLAIGFAAAGGLPPLVVAVRVTPDTVANEAIAEKLANDTVALLRSLDSTFPELAYEDLRLELRHDWFEPGYGVVTPQTQDAVAVAASGGVALETTYTGKALAALLADARAGRLRSQRVLFWDTYNSAPMPEAGTLEGLPPVLHEYVAECQRLFGTMSGEARHEGHPLQ